MAAPWTPPLCANALTPTYGWWSLGTMLATSATKADSSESPARSAPEGTVATPIFSARSAQMVTMLALPHRSP